MKRYICLIISLCLILGSFSFIFASPTSWDTSDQNNLSNAASRLYYNGYSAAYYLKQIADRAAVLSTISSDISTIKGYLFDDNHSIAYWTSAIASWMSPIYNSLTQTPVDLATIIGALGYTTSNSGGTTYTPYMSEFKTYLELMPDMYNDLHRTTGSNLGQVTMYSSYNGSSFTYGYKSTDHLISGCFNQISQALARILSGYGNTQNATNWGSLGNSSFTPDSFADGTFKWLSAIQTPVARLSYVLASDERISAQQAAAAAEQQVVDDFIDPTGDSSATASDFGSISDLSSGYQQNFGSTASVSGIFDIFDSNNFGWFSSETYNQLDTTVAQRGSSFETPLLDQQLEDISRALGVDYVN